MKEVIVKIPDDKLNFFMELISELGIEATEQIDIPDEHKSIVRDRIKTADPNKMIPWEDARKQFDFKPD
jgi:hypothetical protein